MEWVPLEWSWRKEGGSMTIRGSWFRNRSGIYGDMMGGLVGVLGKWCT